MSLLSYILDLLEPAREDPAALVEAHKVLQPSFSAVVDGGAHAWG